MKRSEIIDIMLEFERSATSYKCGRQFMSDLLKTLEDAGMLSPESDRSYDMWDGFGNPTLEYKWDWEPWEPEE